MTKSNDTLTTTGPMSHLSDVVYVLYANYEASFSIFRNPFLNSKYLELIHWPAYKGRHWHISVRTSFNGVMSVSTLVKVILIWMNLKLIPSYI